MKRTMNIIKEDQSSNHSDSDDWTLVSPPHSSGSSPSASSSPSSSASISPPPSPKQELELDSEKSGSNSSLERVDEDGLTEIDLNAASTSTSTRNKNKTLRFHKALQEKVAAKLAVEERSSSTEPLMPGFQPLGSATDDDTTSNGSSRRSSFTRLELGGYLDFGKQSSEASNVTVELEANPEEKEEHQQQKKEEEEEKEEEVVDDRQVANIRQRSVVKHSKSSQADGLYHIKDKLDELSAAAELAHRNNASTLFQRILLTCDQWSQSTAGFILSGNFGLYFLLLLSCIFMTFSLVQFSNISRKIDKNRQRFLENTYENLRIGNIIPSSQEYEELQLLHSELSQCIKRQSPASFKYYMSGDRFRNSDQKTSDPANNMSHKPYRGLVCFGQETHWRLKFEQLKLLYRLDLRKLMQDAKKQVTNEMLEFYHPTLQFKLILNQIEYLDFLENKRNKKQSDETIKYLKAENLQLLRRINQPNETGYQKVVVNLELENSKLRRENEVLKANLVQKAGPTYIKQSLELEQYERENVVLKQFHYQVAQDVSKSLRQFNLHTIDASSVLDDDESLNSQLMLTRGYLRRLNEKIGTVLIENESLKEQLKEAYLLTPINKANLPATHHGNSFYGGNNDSNALIADSCVRNLAELREKTSHLEGEVERLNRKCYKSAQSAELELSSERNLNRTKGDEFTANNWRRISPLETAMNRRSDDNLSLRNDDIVDGLMLFLTKFNNRIESNGLAVLEKSQQDSHQPSQEILSFLENKSQNDQAKIIPNYLREEFVEQPNSQPSSDEETYFDTGNSIDINSPPQSVQLDQQQQPQPTPPPPQVAKMQIPAPKLRFDSSQGDGSLETEQSLSIDPSEVVEYPNVGASDTWFFKRAKQRKQLRRDNKDDRIPKDWTLKRAKLREKLRKASSYMGFDYHAVECSNADCINKHDNHHDQHHYHGVSIDHHRVRLPVYGPHKEPYLPRPNFRHPSPYNKKRGDDKHKKHHRHTCTLCTA